MKWIVFGKDLVQFLILRVGNLCVILAPHYVKQIKNMNLHLLVKWGSLKLLNHICVYGIDAGMRNLKSYFVFMALISG